MLLRLDKEVLKAGDSSTCLSNDATKRLDIDLCAVDDVLVSDQPFEPRLNLDRDVSNMSTQQRIHIPL